MTDGDNLEKILPQTKDLPRWLDELADVGIKTLAQLNALPRKEFEFDLPVTTLLRAHLRQLRSDRNEDFADSDDDDDDDDNEDDDDDPRSSPNSQDDLSSAKSTPRAQTTQPSTVTNSPANPPTMRHLSICGVTPTIVHGEQGPYVLSPPSPRDLGVVCKSCSSKIPVKTKFCTNCGSKLATHCLYCAHELSPGERVCPKCNRHTPRSIQKYERALLKNDTKNAASLPTPKANAEKKPQLSSTPSATKFGEVVFENLDGIREAAAKFSTPLSTKGWVLLAYRPNSTTIYIHSSSTGHMSEMISHLNNDETMYAIVRIDMGENITRDILLNWNGPSVKVITAAKRKSHLGGVNEGLSGLFQVDFTVTNKERLDENNLRALCKGGQGRRLID